MPGNPLIDQGTLNRLRVAVTIQNFPGLNVTPSYLGEQAVSVSLDEDATDYIKTLTGAVASPNVFLPATVMMHLIRAQSLAAQYKAQMEALSLIGQVIVRGDAVTLPNYQINNCSIQRVDRMVFNGTDAGYMVSLHGYYSINNNLWDLI